MTVASSLAILENLVGFDTTSAKSNLDLIEWIETYLAEHKAHVERFEDKETRKASLWISWGPADVPGYVLSGHSDVVPVEGQKWSSDPFKLRRDAGRAYGRGATDMKGFLAVCLAGAPLFASSALKRPIHLAISYDEEVGCLGVRPMLEAIATRQPKPLGCFVGEPTSMQVVNGHKGKVAYHMSLRGTPGHTSRAPRYVNALDYGAAITTEITALAGELSETGRQDANYDIPFTTVVATGMRAGTARNIVPDACELEWECRSLDHDDRALVEKRILGLARDRLAPKMRTFAPNAGIEITRTIDYPGLVTDPTEPIVALGQKLARSNTLGKVAFGTEAGLFTEIAGISAVVVGPGSIAVAHQPDEYIEESQLALCEDFVARLAEHCSS